MHSMFGDRALWSPDQLSCRCGPPIEPFSGSLPYVSREDKTVLLTLGNATADLGPVLPPVGRRADSTAVLSDAVSPRPRSRRASRSRHAVRRFFMFHYQYFRAE